MRQRASISRNRDRSSGREVPGRACRRSTWAAIGAAVAVALGAGSAVTWVAATSSVPSSFVSITPVRILDTRTGLGLENMFGAGVGRELRVTGSVPTPTGPQVVVPPGATAVVLNVTAVEPTADGFVSVRPAGTPGAPSTSNLNVSAGDVIPNSVTVALPTAGATTGRIEITYDVYQARIQQVTHILVDVMGYYVAAAPGSADRIPSGRTVTGYVIWDLQSTGPFGDYQFSVDLPSRAPAPLTDTTVNFSPVAMNPAMLHDPDPSCAGTAEAPTAPPGRVCLYVVHASGVDSLRGAAPGVQSADLRASAFEVEWRAPASSGVNGDMYVSATWAYTAP